VEFDVPEKWSSVNADTKDRKYLIDLLPQGRGMGKPVSEVLISTDIFGNLSRIEITEKLTAPF
ncbi:MAG: hypothetical protein WA918_01485, partial [Erythrobacter sp.]